MLYKTNIHYYFQIKVQCFYFVFKYVLQFYLIMNLNRNQTGIVKSISTLYKIIIIS